MKFEWTENSPPNEDCPYDHCSAETAFGPYRIEWKSWKASDSFIVYGPFREEFIGAADELVKAKGLALADLHRRIGETFSYGEITAPYRAAIRMIRDAIGEMFGPAANLESEEAVLLRGPEPHHDAEAIIAALQTIRFAFTDAIIEAAMAGEGPFFIQKARHKKRGSEYVVMGLGEVQDSTKGARVVDEGDNFTVYVDRKTGKIWLRHPEEFEDGRFEVISS